MLGTACKRSWGVLYAGACGTVVQVCHRHALAVSSCSCPATTNHNLALALALPPSTCRQILLLPGDHSCWWRVGTLAMETPHVWVRVEHKPPCNAIIPSSELGDAPNMHSYYQHTMCTQSATSVPRLRVTPCHASTIKPRSADRMVRLRHTEKCLEGRTGFGRDIDRPWDGLRTIPAVTTNRHPGKLHPALEVIPHALLAHERIAVVYEACNINYK